MLYVERYSHVMHIVSQIEGKLRGEHGRIRFAAGDFPGRHAERCAESSRHADHRGTGRNKARSLRRGAVGYFSFDGSMDMCITIRTLLMQNGTISVQAGGGIVADSDPTAEYFETINKAKAVFRSGQICGARFDVAAKSIGRPARPGHKQ